jgi:Diphthamide biosynthesis methyltransferase
VAAHHGVSIERRNRDAIERNPEPVFAAAESGDAVFVTAGDTMISTTHVDLRVRAENRGIDTRVVNGVSAGTAAIGLSGLQNYRFGKAVTLPFPWAHGGETVPASVIETVEANRDRGLHTLVFLDIKIGRGPEGPDPDHEEYMTADIAAGLLHDDWKDTLAVAVCRAGAPEPAVTANRLSTLAESAFGEPLHLLIIPGELHHVEVDALKALADAPPELL